MAEPRDELAVFLADIGLVMPNLNDTFAYACADTEQITVGDGEILAAFWRRHGWHGLAAIAAVSRGREPLPQVAADPRFQAATAELLSGDPVDDDPEPWTLQDEFELR